MGIAPMDAPPWVLAFVTTVQWKDSEVVYTGSNHTNVGLCIMVKRCSQNEKALMQFHLFVSVSITKECEGKLVLKQAGFF